jgi:MFS family permease
MEKLRATFSFLRGNVLTLVISDVVSRTAISLGWPYFSLFIMALGGSPTIVGFVYAIGVLAGLPTFPIGGYIADHKGRVTLVVIATYLEAFVFSFFIFAQDWTWMIVGLFLWQLGSIHYPILSAILADSLPLEKRGIGFATTMIFPTMVGIIAPYLSGYVIDLYGAKLAMPILWTSSLILNSLAATIRLRFLKETFSTSVSISLQHVPRLLKDSYQSVRESLRWMPRPLLIIAVVSVIMTFFVSIAAPFWIIYATIHIGLTASTWGTVILLLGFVQIGLSIPIGHLVDRYGVRRLIIIALLISVFPVLLFTFSRTFSEVFMVLLSLTVTNAILGPALAS